MLRSEKRILTTHTGSLPRPARLTELYARRIRSDAVEEAEIEAEGRQALRHVIAKQIEAGIDVGNNGEQQREAFFLYVRRRMSGFGGGWTRRTFADVESLLVQALVHMLKAEAWPLARDAPHWRGEAQRFRGDAASRFVPSMRQRIDLGRLYRRALRAMPETIDDQPSLPVPPECPVTLEELLSD